MGIAGSSGTPVHGEDHGVVAIAGRDKALRMGFSVSSQGGSLYCDLPMMVKDGT